MDKQKDESIQIFFSFQIPRVCPTYYPAESRSPKKLVP